MRHDRIAFAVGGLQLLLGIVLGSFHELGGYASEADFYGIYALVARDLFHTVPAELTHSGPGFPFFVWLFALPGLDLFTAAKLVAAVSVSVLGLSAYFIASRLASSAAGLFLQALLYVSLLRFSFVAGNDVPCAALSCLAFAILLAHEEPSARRCLLAGAVAGVAFITRYTALAAIVAGAGGLFLHARSATSTSYVARARTLGAFLLGALLGVGPWLVASWMWFGAPFLNKGYAVVALEVYAPETHKLDQGLLLEMEKRFSSLSDVLLSDPKRVVACYAFDFYRDAVQVVEDLVTLPGAALVGLGLAILFARRTDRWRLVSILGFGVLGFFNVAIVPYQVRYYFGILPVLLLPVAVACCEPWTLLGAREVFARRTAAVLVVCVVGAMSALRTYSYLTTEPVELLRARDALRQHAHPGDRVVAANSMLGFLAGVPSVTMPTGSQHDFWAWLHAQTGVRFLYVGPLEVSMNQSLASLATGTDVPAGLRLLDACPAPAACLYVVQ